MCDDMKFCIHILEAFKMFRTTPTNKSHQSGVRDFIDCPTRHGSSPSPIPKFSICDGGFEKIPRQTVRYIETITAVSLAKCSRSELNKSILKSACIVLAVISSNIKFGKNGLI